MTTIELVEHLLKIANEVIFPALALWLAYLVRQWMAGRIQTPPYEHKVQLQEAAPVAPPIADHPPAVEHSVTMRGKQP